MNETTQFESTHKLDFEVAPWIMGDFIQFRIGTCYGLWRPTGTSYDILAIDNHKKGNGHFEDVLEWFEQSCKRDGKDLRILEVWNGKFLKHLITKRGFQHESKLNLIKKFT
jgi:hypothetical protein